MNQPNSKPFPRANDWTKASLDLRSRQIRKRILEVFQRSGRGHIGASFSLVEILRVLYDEVLKFDPKNPKWADRDRFILSKGHGCITLYSLLAEKGFFPEEELWRFCKSDGLLGGHPEHIIPGVEASTGSLGHGLSIGVGFAMAAKINKKPWKTFVVLGDGESNEGSVWEAALSAGKHQLNQLVVMTDYNKNQSYSSTFEVLNLEPLADKWRAFGFAVEEVDGHDVDQLRSVFKRIPLNPEKPTAIICHTIKGRGVSFMENNLKWHHMNKVDEAEMTRAYQELGV